ncbi:hypothetical protein AKJ09_07137 [Labilithrix luteola]|uniref:Uncharacterized protein n=1 Tax=Labilithrix luteola TaxID=1391654 RepID=A0A0K1Q417_9BACT|nr:hypothetical protein [Labilithrix luteola]AKV00474.1 hypothetical protein AKJ09_07137 [Labilithrix luteola]
MAPYPLPLDGQETTPGVPAPHARAFQAAYEKTAGERDALRSVDLVPITMDVQTAFDTVIGVLPRVKVLRGEIVAQLPTFDVTNIDWLETYALALSYANATLQSSSISTEELPRLAVRASKLRDKLFADASALTQRGLLEHRHLKELRGGSGYGNVALDLFVLVRMMRERWSAIATKGQTELAEVLEAEQLAARIRRSHAARAEQALTMAAAREGRMRAFTLLVRAYGETRRAVTYVRWNTGDADKLVPPLSASSRRVVQRAPPTARQPPDPTTPAPSPSSVPTQRMIPVAKPLAVTLVMTGEG